MRIAPIGHIESPYLTKFGIPRQPGLVTPITSRLSFYTTIDHQALSSLRQGDMLLVTWAFSHNIHADGRWSKTVRPPRLGGNTRMGVFATRSSFRPNDLAISIVEIRDIGPSYIDFIGGDMVDGTPVYGARAYDPRIDRHEDAAGGWTSDVSWQGLSEVILPYELQSSLPEYAIEQIRAILFQDPRPAYTRTGQEDREFWTVYERYVIWFMVQGSVLTVTNLKELGQDELELVRTTGNFEVLDTSIRALNR